MSVMSLYLSPSVLHTQKHPTNNNNSSPFTVCANLEWCLTLSDKPYSTFSDTIHSPPLLDVYLIISPFSANLPTICFSFSLRKQKQSKRLTAVINHPKISLKRPGELWGLSQK